MKRILAFTASILMLWPAFCADLPEGFVEELLVEGLDPVVVVPLPDGRILIGEKNGKVLLVKNKLLQQDPFLELQVDNYNERGLQSIVLDPDYELNNYFYVFYTALNGFNRISRFTANGDNVLVQSEVVLFETDRLSASVHNGGSMVIGSDGLLYFGTGDTGISGNASDLNNTHGKILRIARDGSIPSDNPFFEILDGKDKAIYSYGFRNPFNMAVDPETGLILVNDVGGSGYEEVNALLAGKDYGWPLFEGYKPEGQDAASNYQDPFFAYSHATGCAVVGASFYQPELRSFPGEYWGKFFFADYCNGTIYSLDPENGDQISVFATGVKRLVSIQVTAEGEMLYLQRAGLQDGSVEDNTATENGSLLLIKYTGASSPFVTKNPEDLTVSVDDEAVFQVFASGKSPFIYQWTVNGEVAGGDSSRLVLQDVGVELNGAVIECTISNDSGSVISETAHLYVLDDERPVPEIETPVDTYRYKGGDTIVFSGTAFDAEDGQLDASRLSWKINFHHDDHFHPAMLPQTGSSGTYIIPKAGETSENVWYRIYLTAEDASGLTLTVYQDVFPEKVMVSVKTLPENIQFKLDGKRIDGDTSFIAVPGLYRSVEVDQLVEVDGLYYIFDGWSNGADDRLLSFVVPASDTTIVARYSEIKLMPGTGTGLYSYYYDNFDKFQNEDPDTTVFGNVDYNWGVEGPSNVPVDYFFARYEGYIQPLVSGMHTFYTVNDDGVRLWVDDQILIDDWNNHGKMEFSGNIFLEKGVKYPIKLEYFENTGAALVHLSWQYANNIKKKIIPVEQLYPEYIVAEPKIFPNPFSDVLSIEVDRKQQIQKIEIFSMDGRNILTATGTKHAANITTTDLLPGLYIVKITVDNQVYQNKILKRVE